MDEVQRLAMLFKAFADPTRLRLLKLLHENETSDCCIQSCNGARFLCVNALAHRLSVTQSAVSQHLRILRQVDLVNGVRCGNFVHYSLNRDSIKEYGAVLNNVLGVSFLVGD
jgi:ArsR family transcriptional regulator